MIILFLVITGFNLLCLSIAAVLGYLVMWRGSAFAPYHQLAGVLATISCCAVHCIVFTYFVATAKWAQHAIEVKHLDAALIEPTRSFKAQAFPAALAAMFAVFVAAVVGVATFSYGIDRRWHHATALIALAVNLVAAVREYGAIVRNGRLIDRILSQIQPNSAAPSQRL